MPAEVESGAAAHRTCSPFPLVLLRHGESAWNRNKRFQGWTDVELTEHGRQQAVRAGEILRARGFAFDVCFSSRLRRSAETARIVLDTMGAGEVPLRCSWQLNERHYGALQGLTWWQGLRRFGPRALRCQGSFAVSPPALTGDDPRHPARDPLYADLDPERLPAAESIADTLARVEPCWDEEIAPEIRRGRRVLVVSHRNTLCALIKRLEGTSDAAFARLDIPTGAPLVYELDTDLRARRHYFVSAERSHREEKERHVGCC